MNFQAALIESVKQLKKVQSKGLLDDFLIIGAFALARVANPRATGDIDFAIRTKSKLSDIARALKGKARMGDLSDPLLGCITFNVGKSNPVPIQLIQFPPAIEEAAFWDAETKTFAKTKVPFASAKALLLLKLYAGSPLDLQDAENILRISPPNKAVLSELRTHATRLRLSRRLEKVLVAAKR